MFTNRTSSVHAIPAIEESAGLRHMDSDFCWCEPIVEMDENGEQMIVHREIVWN